MIFLRVTFIASRDSYILYTMKYQDVKWKQNKWKPQSMPEKFNTRPICEQEFNNNIPAHTEEMIKGHRQYGEWNVCKAAWMGALTLYNISHPNIPDTLIENVTEGNDVTRYRSRTVKSSYESELNHTHSSPSSVPTKIYSNMNKVTFESETVFRSKNASYKVRTAVLHRTD